MTSKRLAAAAVGGLFSALALAGCGGDDAPAAELADGWDAIVEAANEEGEVTIYSTHSPDNLEKLKKAFEAEYPDIELTYVRGTDADILPKVEVENETGQGTVDVHMTTDAGWIDRSLETDYSAEIVGPSFENEAYDPANSIIEDKWFLTSATVFVLGWNTDKWPEGLDTPEDVLDPKLKGKIGITNPAGIPTYADLYRHIDENFGEDYLERLAANEPKIYDSAVAIGQAIASGEIWASPVAATTLLADKENGAPVEIKVPDNAWGVPWYSHVLATAPHTNAAQVLADFLVTEAGQEAISADYVAALPDVKGTGIPGADVLAQDVELADPATLTQESVNEFQAEWEALFLG
jgi:iron(III) transport system substrate-binding protein